MAKISIPSSKTQGAGEEKENETPVHMLYYCKVMDIIVLIKIYQCSFIGLVNENLGTKNLL